MFVKLYYMTAYVQNTSERTHKELIIVAATEKHN